MDMKTFGRSTAGVPTQTYSASNFVGTPVPTVGQVGVTPTAQNISGNRMHVVLIVVGLIALGYALHHWFFEK